MQHWSADNKAMPDTPLWHPVMPAHALRAGDNVLACSVLGQELAVWRSAAGQVQAWEDRCPHRGVALSLGRVQGDRLACAYHGWEYAAGSGRCIAIPALPDIPVPGNVCVKTYTALESNGMVWVHIGDRLARDSPAPLPLLPDDAAPARFLRTMGLRASAQQVDHALSAHGYHRLSPCHWRGELAQQPVHLFVLSAQAHLCLLHLACATEPPRVSLIALFGAARLLRGAIESGAP